MPERQPRPLLATALAALAVAGGVIGLAFADPANLAEPLTAILAACAIGAELIAAGVQLAAYRLGWARLAGVPVEQVSAGFHHVAANLTLRPVDLLDEAGLLRLVTDPAD